MAQKILVGRQTTLINIGVPVSSPSQPRCDRTRWNKTKKGISSYYGLSPKLKGLLALEISKFTKICKFQKNLYANLKLLNDYGWIILIKTNKKAYVCVCFIFKIGDPQVRESAFPFYCVRWNRKLYLCACNVSNFEDEAYTSITFFVYPIKTNKKAYISVCFIFKIRDATSVRIYFPILVHALK